MKRVAVFLGIAIVLSLFIPACNFSAPVQLGDYIWMDYDKDGIQDPNENGLPNVVVTLYKSDGTKVASTTSNPEGRYAFSNLEPGDYFLEFDAPKKSQFSDQNVILTKENQGTDDSLDSDANSDTRRTEIFALSARGENLTLDAGYTLWSAETANQTPTPSSTPTLAAGSGGGKQVITIPACGDTYVWNAQPSISFGEEQTFWVYKGEAIAYLCFPLDGIPANAQILSAAINLFIHPNSTAAGSILEIALVAPGQSLSENNITYTSMPNLDLGIPPVEHTLSAYNNGSMDSIFADPLVRQAIINGYDRSDYNLWVQVKLGKLDQSKDHSQEWYSSEIEKGPTLEVQYTTP